MSIELDMFLILKTAQDYVASFDASTIGGRPAWKLYMKYISPEKQKYTP